MCIFPKLSVVAIVSLARVVQNLMIVFHPLSARSLNPLHLSNVPDYLQMMALRLMTSVNQLIWNEFWIALKMYHLLATPVRPSSAKML